MNDLERVAKKMREVLENYRSTAVYDDSGYGCDYNNDEVIEVCNEYDRIIKNHVTGFSSDMELHVCGIIGEHVGPCLDCGHSKKLGWAHLCEDCWDKFVNPTVEENSDGKS